LIIVYIKQISEDKTYSIYVLLVKLPIGILLYISEGLKNTEIADKMFVSINTVKTHIKNIFVKLDVSNRIQATNKAKVL
jgi:LuxR family maltose regulon positive regulatory protein